MSKILFSDLDGTLLNDDKTISEENKNAIAETIKKGNYFVIATGRPFYAVTNIVKELGLNRPGGYVLSFNGGLITDMHTGRDIYEKYLDFGIVEEIFRVAKDEGIYVQTYHSNKIYCMNDGEEARHYAAVEHPVIVPTGMNVLSYLPSEPCKCLAINLHDRQRLEDFAEKYGRIYKGILDFFFSGPDYLEIMPHGENKGAALKRLAGYLNVFDEDTIAVGDEENDITMIKEAALGCAMVNAKDAVKADADYITVNDNNHSAIAEIIQKFMS